MLAGGCIRQRPADVEAAIAWLNRHTSEPAHIVEKVPQSLVTTEDEREALAAFLHDAVGMSTVQIADLLSDLPMSVFTHTNHTTT